MFSCLDDHSHILLAERIDANLLDLTIDELKEVPKEVYVKRLDRVKSKTTGKLIVKEYPTATAGYGTVTHVGVWDAASSGNMLA